MLVPVQVTSVTLFGDDTKVFWTISIGVERYLWRDCYFQDLLESPKMNTTFGEGGGCHFQYSTGLV